MSKERWETYTIATVYITTYRIFHPQRKGGKFEVEYVKREPLDCYSSTLVNNWYPVAKAKTLKAAKAAAVKHEKANREKDDD